MPTWGEILQELNATAGPSGRPDWDAVRRKYIAALHAITGRDTIIYYTDWMGSSAKPGTSIVLGDMQGMMEVNKGLRGPGLDLILHSPGGSAEATASVVRYLRTKFDDIRVFVPLAAMSAATMWALAGDQIVMGRHSQLGPIDPQMLGADGQYHPASAILKQFERAKDEISADNALLAPWVPILQSYGPSMLQECERAEVLARSLVEQWLRSYMFRGDRRRASKAKATAKWFSQYGASQSHALGIDRDQARAHNVSIADLEADAVLQDAVLSVHHATILTLNGPAAKIVENHLGRAWVQIAQQVVVQVAPGGPPGAAPPASPT
jgi:hypothetical protein